MAKKYLTEEDRKRRELIGDVRSQRKAILKSFGKKYPGQALGWQNGSLVFLDDGKKVPDAPVITKPVAPQNPAPDLRRLAYFSY